jgi:ribonuclease BN (tRNA processing enzyme)
VLGSGGPIADDGRASSSYLVWQDGKARVLVDTGSGSFLRFGESGARFEDLQLVAISHFHTDHSAGLPGLLKTGNFSDRDQSLLISGPSGNGRFPGLKEFLDDLLTPGRGVYRYLGGYLDGSDGLAELETVELPRDATGPRQVMDTMDIRVSALPVPHGIVPSLAYRVEVGEKVLVFGADQNGSSERFSTFARNADVLVAHMAIPENAGRVARSLHARPSTIGEMAENASVRLLLLSHFMARSLRDLEVNQALITENYGGEVRLAEDLFCLIP